MKEIDHSPHKNLLRKEKKAEEREREKEENGFPLPHPSLLSKRLEE